MELGCRSGEMGGKREGRTEGRTGRQTQTWEGGSEGRRQRQADEVNLTILLYSFSRIFFVLFCF